MTEPLASSWSRRRAAVAAEAEAEATAAAEAAHAAEQAALAEKTDAEILEDLGLPDPDTLVQGDDFKAFMSKAVPKHIRKRALRKLWRSNPVLACVDGLNDYDDDYLTQGLGQGAIKTSYQVGKGMLAHILEVERLKAVATEVDDMPDDSDTGDAVDVAAEQPAVADAPEQIAEAPQEPTTAVPRRMQFQFEDDSA